jgi:hypothetical protein
LTDRYFTLLTFCPQPRQQYETTSSISDMVSLTIVAVLVTCTNIICYAFQPAASNTNFHHHEPTTRTPLFSTESLADTEEEDATFFFRASRQAAKDRYEKLTNGEDPFGLFGRSTDKDDAEKPISAPPVKPSLESSDEPPTTEVMDKSSDISDSQYSEILSNISVSAGESNEKGSSHTQNKYNFHKRLMEARFAMETAKPPKVEPDTAEAVEVERKNRLDAAIKAKESVESTQFEANTSPLPTATLEERKPGPGCIRKVQDEPMEEKITYRNKNELLSSLYPEISTVQESEEEVMTKDLATPVAAPVEMADRKQTDESFSVVESNISDVTSDRSGVNEENVAMGLLVLTRSFITLKQIVDSKTK